MHRLFSVTVKAEKDVHRRPFLPQISLVIGMF